MVVPRAPLSLLFAICVPLLAGCHVLGPPQRLDFSNERLDAPLACADGATTTLREQLDARVTLLLFTDATRTDVGGPRRGLDVASDIAAESDDVRIVEFVRTDRGAPARVTGTPAWRRITSTERMPAHRAGLSHDGDRPTYIANGAGVATLIEPDIRGRLALFEDASAGLPAAPMLVGLSVSEATERFGPPRTRLEDGTLVYDYSNPPHVGRTRATVRAGVIVDARTNRRHRSPTVVAFVVPGRSVPLTARELLGARGTDERNAEAPGEIVSLTLERVDSGRSVTIRTGDSARVEPGDYRLSVFVRATGGGRGDVRDLGIRPLFPGDRVVIDAFEELRLDPNPPVPERRRNTRDIEPPTWEPSPLPFRSAHHRP